MRPQLALATLAAALSAIPAAAAPPLAAAWVGRGVFTCHEASSECTYYGTSLLFGCLGTEGPCRATLTGTSFSSDPRCPGDGTLTYTDSTGTYQFAVALRSETVYSGGAVIGGVPYAVSGTLVPFTGTLEVGTVSPADTSYPPVCIDITKVR